jgi:phospholipase C
MQATLDANGQLALVMDPSDPNYGKIVHDGNITPINALYDQNYAVNTIFSKNLAPTGNDPNSAALLPSQNDSDPNDPTRPYIPTIGDRLDDAGVSWKWYSGGWGRCPGQLAEQPRPLRHVRHGHGSPFPVAPPGAGFLR